MPLAVWGGQIGMEGEQALGYVPPPFPVCVSGSLRLSLAVPCCSPRLDFRGCLLRILPTLPSAPRRNLPCRIATNMACPSRANPGIPQSERTRDTPTLAEGWGLRSKARKAGSLLARTGAFSRCGVTITPSCGSRWLFRMPAAPKRSSMRPFQLPILPPRSTCRR